MTKLECSVRDYCDEAESFAKCSVVTDIQESKKVAQGCQGYVRTATMNSVSMTPQLVLPFLSHFIAFATLTIGSHSISFAQAQKNSPNSKQC